MAVSMTPGNNEGWPHIQHIDNEPVMLPTIGYLLMEIECPMVIYPL